MGQNKGYLMNRKEVKYMIEKTLFEYWTENALTYQDLEKMADDEWVLVNSNVLYYLLSYYQRRKVDTRDFQCREILSQHFEDIHILKYYTGIDEENAMYQHLSVMDAKILFMPWKEERRILARPLVVLKENNHKFPFSFSQFKKWRNSYIQEKRLEEEKESNQQELIYRNKRGYMV